MGTDVDIERAARVSYGFGTRKASQTRGLIRYLRRHRHTSPSEMVELKFHCAMPIFVARQWIRHRTANLNEMSGRYSLMPMLFYKPPAEQVQVQNSKNNQGRSGTVLDEKLRDEAYGRWDSSREAAVANYEWLCGNEVARELARIDLPLSTYTQWYWKIDLHNLLHFLTLRVDSHAQWEIREFGRVMAGMLKRIAPLSYEAWIDYDLCGARLSRMELDVLRALVRPSAEGLAAEGRMSPAEMEAKGLSRREADELLAALNPRAVPDFELDLSQAKPASFFEQESAAAVPVTIPKPSDG
jgi:thymidylate synthase (FAD)